MIRLAIALSLCLGLSACGHWVARSGPSVGEVSQRTSGSALSAVQLVTIDQSLARNLASQRRQQLFSEVLGQQQAPLVLGRGDTIEVNIWEAPPATLFGTSTGDLRAGSAARMTVVPEQLIDQDGYINVPFAGRVRASGISLREVEAEIVRRLSGKANKPEAVVRVIKSAAAAVTVVGEVSASNRQILTVGGLRVLDALAAAGGVKHPIGKTTLQLTRNKAVHSLPLTRIVQDPAQNVPLHPGDVLAVLFQPLSFNVLGATGKNEEIAFETQGISLAQALARAGGLADARADRKGVFLFRFEAANALAWPQQPVATMVDGTVPVVYRLDLSDPGAFFAAQGFMMNDKDLLYVSNAPAAELQKFLTLISTVVYPVLSTVQTLN